MFVHEDERRKLIEWAEGDFKVAKALIAKPGCIVGDHYHRSKDEIFFLLIGNASYVIIGNREWHNAIAPSRWEVPRGSYHRFELDEGSILLGVGTELFDAADEIKGIRGCSTINGQFTTSSH